MSSVVNIICGASDMIKLKFKTKISVYHMTMCPYINGNVICGASDVIKLKFVTNISF
jgi:hypothetical protein